MRILHGLRIGLLAIAALTGCGRGKPAAPVRLPVDVYGDTARTIRLVPPGGRPLLPPVSGPPRAAVWLARVSPAPLAVEPLAPAPDSLGAAWPAPPALAIDHGLKPPLPRSAARLRVPAGTAPRWVELDVRVDEEGSVTDAEWAAGSRDTALVSAATECALAMRFFPALQAGRAVAVWCRQRFDFGR